MRFLKITAGSLSKKLWWTSLIPAECALIYSMIYYVCLEQLRRIAIYIQIVEKSWSMCTRNYMLKYTIVIIFMASLFWKIPKLTLNFWWYSSIHCVKTAGKHWKSKMFIFHLKSIFERLMLAYMFRMRDKNPKKTASWKRKNGIVLFVNLYNTRTI